MTLPLKGFDRTGPSHVLLQGAVVGPIAASVAFVVELTLVPLLLPTIQQQFALSLSELAWVFNAYGIAVALGVLIAGAIGDRFNARVVFGIGVALFAAGSALAAFAWSYESLLAWRALQGLGGGIFSPLVPLLLTRASPERPGKILIIWGSVSGYTAAISPVLFGGVLQDADWTWGFIFIAGIAFLPNLAFARAKIQHEAVPVARSKVDFRSVFRSLKVWIMLFYVFCTYGAITYYLFSFPVWLSENQVQTSQIGFLLSVLWLSFAGFSTLLRNLVDKPHVRMILLGAPILIAIGFPLAYFCENDWCLFLSVVFVGSGLAFSNAPSTQLILKFAPKGTSAVAASLDISFARLGGAATVALLAQATLPVVITVIVLLSTVALICARRSGRALREIAATVSAKAM